MAVPPARLRSGLRIEVLDERKVFWLSEHGNTFGEDPLTAAIAAGLDGTRTLSEIVSGLAGRFSPMVVYGRLQGLRERGLVLEAPQPVSEVGRWLEASGLAVRDAGTSIRTQAPEGTGCTSRLALLDLRTGAPSGVTPALVEPAAALGLVIDVLSADLLSTQTGGTLVVLVDDYLDPRLAGLNADRLARAAAGEQADWVLVKTRGREVWVGPRLVPGQTGCWTCLADRLQANRQVERYLAARLGWPCSEVTATGEAPGAAGTVAVALSPMLAALAAGTASPLDGEMVTLDTGTFGSRRHTLVRMPQCPACGDGTHRVRRTADVDLGEGLPPVATDNGYRTASATATLARLEHHVSPHLGAVSRLESIGPDSDGLAYSFAAGHNFAMVHDNLDLLRTNMRGQSGGKGRTEEQARTSAVCEALERFCGLWSPDVPSVRGSFTDLRSRHRLVHPAECLLFSPAQYAGRRAWNDDPAHRLHRVPEPFDVDAEGEWTPARSLTRGDEVLVPSGLVWFGDPDVARRPYAVTDSNGGAAGSTVAEAVLQGLCELVERDAVGIWWYNRLRRPKVDLDSVEDPYVGRLLEYYASLDRSVWVLDLRADLGMPVFAAVSRRHHDVEDVMVGFGAHPDPDIALVRALTELNQFLPFVARRDEHGATRYRTDDPATLAWLRTVTVADEPWLLPAEDGVTALEDLAAALPRSIPEIVQQLVAELDDNGLETLVVDQTRPDIELAVVKVIVPGLRHFWRRNGPGRLYDVPVALGWRDRPTREEDLNPWAVFF